MKSKALGFDELQRRLAAMPDAANAEIGTALIEAGFNIQRVAKRSIQRSPADPKTGRSSPGNAPKTDTGTLVNSIYVDPGKSEKPTVFVGTNLLYGKHLEHGTKDIDARPWLQPAFEQTKQANLKLIIARMRAVVKRAGK